MLNAMRRNVRNLSWVLWLVIIAFVAFYIPDLIRGPSNVIARVDGEPIYVAEYQQALQQQSEYYRSVSGGNLPDDFLQQIQIEQIVLEQIIRERLILAAARDQGLSVSNREINERIRQYPAFLQDGVFIGPDRYKQVLRSNGIAFDEFESQLADEILFQKFTELVANGVTVTDREIEDVYQRANEQVQFDFFVVRATGLEAEASELLTDAAARTLFAENIADYRLPEQRQVSYAVIGTEEARDTVSLTEEELQRAYDDGVDEFTICRVVDPSGDPELPEAHLGCSDARQPPGGYGPNGSALGANDTGIGTNAHPGGSRHGYENQQAARGAGPSLRKARSVA